MAVSLNELRTRVGQSIGQICSNGFDSPAQNHCAHFVSHALGIRLGMLCGDMKFETRRSGASIRCDELYNRLARRGPWADRPAAADGLLVFVLSARNVRNGIMSAVPQKHVGIHFGGSVFHFSNSQGKVVEDSSVTAFHDRFKRIYAGGDVSLYHGVPQ